MQDTTAAGILERLSDLENHPDEALIPYEEFKVRDDIYYFTPGGFLYRKDPGTEEVGGFFCGYLTDKVGVTGPPASKGSLLAATARAWS